MTGSTGSNPAIDRGGWGVLALATAGFAVNFWAWALLSPLGPLFKDELALSTVEQAVLVAVPVVVGALGRIPVGALTDRFGGRVMFPAVSAATIVPVLFIGLFGHTSLLALLVGGFFLGIGGTAFAVGVPLVNGWFPPRRRGMALGVFGAVTGIVGAACGLGGFVPPLLMGVLYEAFDSYGPGLALLAGTAVMTVLGVRALSRQSRPA